jgi:4-amino-4-deoxy-L-arabinose transferase-like glycosyltransferase
MSIALGGAILIVAGVNFFVGLGSSSLYIDEGLSWAAASAPLRDVIDRVAAGEISPPLHYLALHEVIGRFSDSEVALRLPSALAGVALVAAILWVGTRAAGPRAGAVAAALAAVSPLLLEYSQQARAYVFATLAVTVAAGALLEAERREPGSPARRAWLIATAASSIVGVWTHYTAALVILPLFASAVLRRAIDRREAFALGATGVAWLALAPLLVDQLDNGNEKGVAHLGRLSVGNVVQAVGTPFDSRYGNFDLTPLTVGGAVVVAAAAVAALTRPPREGPVVRSLILPLAFLPLAAMLAVTILGPDVLLTRYLAVTAPFMLILIGALVTSLSWPGAVATALVAAICALGGSIATHTVYGRYLDWRAGTREVSARVRAGDAVLLGYPPSAAVFDYYKAHTRLTWLRTLPANSAEGQELVARKARLWLFDEPANKPAAIRAYLALLGYRAQTIQHFQGNETLGLTLAVPIANSAAASRRPIGGGIRTRDLRVMRSEEWDSLASDSSF